MRRKGFVLTMDVMLALVVSAVFITMIMYFVTAPKPKIDAYLYSVGGDVLAVAEREGSLADAMNGKPAALESLMASMPENLCLNITVANSTGSQLLSRGTGCPEPPKYVIAKRAAANATADYIAKARVWYR